MRGIRVSKKMISVGMFFFVVMGAGSVTRSASGSETLYQPRGVGGGGAMSSYSLSPYSQLRLVGTDMGTLFRSLNGGKSWQPISQLQVKFGSDLDLASQVGFSSDPRVLFYAESGRDPKRSRDEGATWRSIPIPLKEGERIKYWVGDSRDPKFILCATNQGLLRSLDFGDSWKRVEDVQGDSIGTFLEINGTQRRIYHATPDLILISMDRGQHFKSWYTPRDTKIRAFTGGSDSHGVTLAFIDSNGKDACSWVAHARDSNSEEKEATLQDCGFVWMMKGKGGLSIPRFSRTGKFGGHFIRMAENDSQTLYLTGGKWVRQYGSKVWVSRDAGTHWKLQFQIYDWDQHPYRPWPKDRLEYSAVGLDVGWDDNEFFSFSVNPRNSAEAGGTGHYFLSTTNDFGSHWRAPFTQFADVGERARQKKWKSTGLEVTSVLRLKFNPRNPLLGYAGLSDLGGYVTEDGGTSWRISKVKYNTNYDFAFDPKKADRVFSASGSQHDFPLNSNADVHGEGGIFISEDRGHVWKRLTPESEDFNRQFLSVAYDPFHHILYGGTQGAGITRSTDGGKHWEWYNSGLPKGSKIIPQITIDPSDGTAYCLLAGDPPTFENSDLTGIYRLNPLENDGWQILRGNIRRPFAIDSKDDLWNYPSSFAVDFSQPGRKTLWLTDIENHGAWLASGVWKSTDGGQDWNRVLQMTHPTSIVIDPENPEIVYATGIHDVSGQWGQGGAYYTTDGGVTWRKNESLPLQANLFAFTPDPSDQNEGFYLAFGGGMLYGPRHPAIAMTRFLR